MATLSAWMRLKNIMRKNKTLIVCYSFQYDAYMKYHKVVLEEKLKLNTEYLLIDKLKCSKFAFKRKSYFLLMDIFFAIYYLLKINPSTIITMSPKIGIVFHIAGWLVRVPKRIHWYTGQFWAIKGRKSLFYFLDKMIYSLCTKVMCDAKAQKDFLIENGIGEKSTIIVPGYGSISGIKNKFIELGIEKLRNPPPLTKSTSICFVGRISKEKRLDIIFEVAKNLPNWKFYIAGPLDNSIEAEEAIEKLRTLNNTFIHLGFMDPIEIFRNCDFLIAPSDREGFSSVALEASAALVIPLVTDIYGYGSSVIKDVTGKKFPAASFSESCTTFLQSLPPSETAETKLLRLNGFRYALKFRKAVFTKNLSEAYLEALHQD